MFVSIGVQTWRELLLIKLYQRSGSRVRKEQIESENECKMPQTNEDTIMENQRRTHLKVGKMYVNANC